MYNENINTSSEDNNTKSINKSIGLLNIQKDIHKKLYSLTDQLNNTLPITLNTVAESIRENQLKFSSIIEDTNRLFQENTGSIFLNTVSNIVKFPLESFNTIINDYANKPLESLNTTIANIVSIKDLFRTQFESTLKIINQINTPIQLSAGSVQPNFQLPDEFSRVITVALNNYQSISSKAFGINLMNSVGSIVSDDNNTNLDEILTQIKNTIKDECAKLPQSNNLYAIILSIILFIFSIMDNHYLSKTSEEAAVKKIETLKKELITNIDIIRPNNNIKNDTVYFVIKTTKSFIKPNRKKGNLDILYPNMALKLVERKNRWIYVEYFDFVEGLPKYGWVVKKYCKLFSH